MMELWFGASALRKISIFFITIYLLIIVSSTEGCQFNPELYGEWFQSGRAGRLPVLVNRTHFSEGKCIEVGKTNRYLIYIKEENCHKCMVINMKHHNVIQYKESFCEPVPRSLASTCHDITGDATLFSMFRLHTKPVKCPFSGPLTFTYSKGYGECSDPVSQVDSCAEDSRLLFRQQACADLPKSESKEEELLCLGVWKDGSNHYLAGKLNHRHANSDEDRYRCFIYEKPSFRQREHNQYGSNQIQDSEVWHLSVSADATCQGLVSANEGSTTMKLRKAPHAGKKCKFPTWFSATKHWHTLDFSQSYFLYHHNTSLKISNGTKAPQNIEVRGHTDLRLVCHEYQSLHDSTDSKREEQMFDAHKRDNHNHEEVKIVVHFTVGCRSGYKCMIVNRRDKHVVQMQFGHEALSPDEACNSYYWQPSTDNYITLISQGENIGSCGPLGRYHIPNILGSKTCLPGTIGQSFKKLTVGCTSFDTLQLHAQCPEETAETYQCHSQWESDGVTFVVASPLSRASAAPRRVCFAYNSDGDDSPNMIFTSRHDTCISRQQDAPLIFNATLTGKCAEASGISSSSDRLLTPFKHYAFPAFHCSILILPFLLLVVLSSTTLYFCDVRL